VSGSDLNILLVAEADQLTLSDYVTEHNIRLPVISDRDFLRENRIPGVPFAIVATHDGAVRAAGGVNSLEQIEMLLARSRPKPDDLRELETSEHSLIHMDQGS